MMKVVPDYLSNADNVIGNDIASGMGYDAHNDYGLARMFRQRWFEHQISKKDGREMFSGSFIPKSRYPKLIEAFEAVQQLDYVGPLRIWMFSKDIIVGSNESIFILGMRDSVDNRLHISSSKNVVERLQTEFGKDEREKVRLSWWYYDQHAQVDDCNIDFVFDNEAKDAYYPCLPNGIDSFLDSYWQSNAPILILMGDPGTGKTSFIKHFIQKYSLNTMVTYDEQVMSSDYFYIQYLTSSDKSLMVLEDADLLLESREHEGNKTMSKLLNVSDGLVKLQQKKIIFTANIKDFKRIDEALTRPGRCFNVLEFGELSYEEAVNAAKVAEQPPLEERRNYTLSEIFNRYKPITRQKIGFA